MKWDGKCMRCGFDHPGGAASWQCYRFEAQRAWKEVESLRAIINSIPRLAPLIPIDQSESSKPRK